MLTGLRVVAAAEDESVEVEGGGAEWWDCGDSFAMPRDRRWTDVQSSRAVVHKGDQQKVMKTGYATAAHSNITIE